LRHEIRPRNPGVAKTAERLRKPESGSEAGVNEPSHYGARQGDAVEGARKPQEVISRPTGRQGQEEAKRLCKGQAARKNEPVFSDVGDR
jgi:hypothetical protein